MTDDHTPEPAADRYQRLPPLLPMTGVVATVTADELPYGGPEGGGETAVGGDGD